MLFRSAQLGASLPLRLRCGVGFPSAGRRAKAQGECWDSSASDDGATEILLRPDLPAAPADGALERAYATALAVQLVHAAVGPGGDHDDARTLARGLGLTGPMRAPVAGPAFLALIAPILAAAGPLPHACLRPAEAGDDDADQVSARASRHVRCACPTCGYVARTTRKWITDAGPPHCPSHGPMQVAAADRDAVAGPVTSEASRPAMAPAVARAAERAAPVPLFERLR